jgi:hypothetical protein
MIPAGMKFPTGRGWLSELKADPVAALISTGDEIIIYFTRRDLLEEKVGRVDSIWSLPPPQKLLKGQLPDGSWTYQGTKKPVYPPHHYSLVETFKRFRVLVRRYGFDRQHEVLARAAEYLFSCQTVEGDIRGMIGNQYATYYTGEILSLLVKAGYQDDPRIEKGLQWLLSMRQDDGGWTIPILTHHFDGQTMYRLTSQKCDPVLPDRGQPFSHNWTDMALRAFAAHDKYRQAPEVKEAAGLLKSRFFKPDVYTSYKSPKYWTTFRFWWPNLLTALDSLSQLGFSRDDPDINYGLEWFPSSRGESFWKTGITTPGIIPGIVP